MDYILDFSTRESRQKFYQSREWYTLRLFMLRQKPLCEYCLKKGIIKQAIACDHKRDIKFAPHLRLEPSNITCLCTECHNRKTSREAANSELDYELYNKKWTIDIKEFNKKPK